jgi:hypothetical protein
MKVFTRILRILGRTQTGILLGGMSVACAGSIDGPGGKLVIQAESVELREGGSTRLVALFDGRQLGQNEVEWLSRDPATITVRGGVVTAVFPGISYAVATHGTAIDSVRIVVRFSNLQPGQAGVRIGSEGAAHILHGVTVMADYMEDGALAYTTSVLASSGAPPAGDASCCQLFGDTLIQVSFRAAPSTGIRMLEPPVETNETRLREQILRRGPDDALLMIRESDQRMRFYMPVKPATLELSRAELPLSGQPGLIEGRVAFEAAGVYQTQGSEPGTFVYTPIGNRTITIYAEFSTRVRLSHVMTPH